MFNKLNKSLIIGFEGMPRSGKTSTLKRLMEYNNARLVTLEEIYFSKEQLAGLTDKRGTIVESKWFIDCEEERAVRLKNLDKKAKIVIADRTYLSTLAYCYARSKVNSNPEEFEELVKYVKSKKQYLIPYSHIILFDNSAKKTINRRRGCSRVDLVYWSNQRFMNHFESFYQNMIHKYTNASIIRLDARNISVQQTYLLVKNIIEKLTVNYYGLFSNCR
ncbi:hypothetical protein M1403_00110 [Patescibacteria group bacterium]|nr:hypothetical protein [Patescibacteria group bacterium]